MFNSGGGEVNHPVGGAVVPPKFLGGDRPDVAGKDRRAVMAEWITSAENPFFSVSVANRVWAHFTGVGIVDPVDDFRVSNPQATLNCWKSWRRSCVNTNLTSNKSFAISAILKRTSEV